MNRYVAYYSAQQSGGGIQGFQGSVYNQKGRGLGSIFRSLLKYVTPILKPVARSLGTEALGMTHNILNDLHGGIDLKPSIRRNSRVAMSNLLHKTAGSVLKPQTGSGHKRRRTIKSPSKRSKSGRKKRKQGRKIRLDYLD